jgi:hypothetical protein
MVRVHEGGPKSYCTLGQPSAAKCSDCVPRLARRCIAVAMVMPAVAMVIPYVHLTLAAERPDGISIFNMMVITGHSLAGQHSKPLGD